MTGTILRIITSFKEYDGMTLAIVHDGRHYHAERQADDGVAIRQKEELCAESAISYLGAQLEQTHCLLTRHERSEPKVRTPTSLSKVIGQITAAIADKDVVTPHSTRMISVGQQVCQLDLSKTENQPLAVAYIIIASKDEALPGLKAEIASVCQTSFARHNKVLRKAQDNDLIGAVEKALEQALRIQGMTSDQAMDDLKSFVTEAGRRHSRLGLRIGHLGNTQMFGAGERDDKSWYVFTKVSSANVKEYKFGGMGTKQLPALLIDIEERLEDWLCHLEEEMSAGRAHSKP